MTFNMDNISYSDIKNICRTCLLSCDVKFTQDKLISDIFYKLTDIHLEVNDEFPQHICPVCFDKINEIYEFASQCKRTHFSLLQCINNFKNSQMDEEQVTLVETNRLLKTEDEITIDENRIIFIKEEMLSSTSECVIDELKIKKDVKEEKNNVLEENMSPEASGDQPINYSQDDLLKIHTLNIKVEKEEESNCNVNLNDPNEDTYASDINDNSYINSAEYHEEITKNTKTKHYKCDVCNKAFSQLKAFVKHKSLPSCKRIIKCEQCLKSFSHSSSLKRHMVAHSGELPFICEHCSKSFSHSSNLKRHIRTHNSERPYKCENCSKSFTQSYHLKEHMRTHVGERPFKCEQCFKLFSQSSHLKSHLRTHSDECPYKCEQCSESFKYITNLEIHMRTHSGGCPFKCERCLKSFSHSSSLKRHMVTHSSERPIKCENV